MKKLPYQITIFFVVLNLLIAPVAPAFAQEGTPEAPTAITEAETPTATPVAETATPAATETSTPQPVVETPTITPSATATTTVTPEAVAPEFVLTLSSNPNFLNKNGKVKLTWEIQGDLSKKTDLVLQISLPEGFTAALKKGDGTFDTKTRLLTVPVTKNKGDIALEASEVKSSSYFIATLQNGQNTLANAEFTLPLKEEFKVARKGDTITALDGKLKVKIPADTFGEDVTIQVGAPNQDNLPISSLSGQPFEITAVGETKTDGSRQSFHEFGNGKEVEFEVQYEDFLTVPEGREGDLAIWWYNPQTSEWEGIASVVDPKTKTIRATTKHFSLFDVGLNNWNASRVPSTDSFQVAEFTGSGTYSFPIEVPAGAAGFQPSLSLNYNSQVIDQSTSETQASWVGMGWSLDSGSIDRDYRNTYNDSVLLSVGGVSSRLVRLTTGFADWHFAEENGWKVVNASYESWTIRDNKGNTYVFDYKAVNCGTIYRWLLTKQIDSLGHEIEYTYSTETKPVSGCTSHQVTAIYPSTITYPNDGYRIRYVLNTGRADYQQAWATDLLYHTFQKSYLKTIYVERDTSGNGSFSASEVIRSYTLNYTAANSPSQIWPGFTYSAGGKVLTLESIEEKGVGGASLKTTSFAYPDRMHLESVNNGYGGNMFLKYENSSAPYVAPNPRPDETKQGPAYTTLQAGGEATTSCDVLRPGSVYRVTARTESSPSVQSRVGIKYANGTYYYGPFVNGTNAPQDITYTTQPIPANAANLADLAVSAQNGSVFIHSYKCELLPTFYRVSHRYTNPNNTGYIGPGSTYSYPTQYSYQNPVMNTADTYESDPYQEFRGHGTVTVLHPDGTKTVTTYNQGDILKGKPIQVSEYDGSGTKLSSTTSYTYVTTALPVGDYAAPAPVHNWIYTSQVVKTMYDLGGINIGSTKSEYLYNSYYNLSSTKEYNGTTLYRTTNYEYAPNTTENITSLPSRKWVTDAGGSTLAETLYLYDGSNTYTTPPTDGLLTAVRTLVNGTEQYAQTSYGYNDTWGNQTSVTTYTGLTANKFSAPTTGAATTSTVFDSTYRTYPLTITNALGQVTTITYDYTKGVPLTATDPNGAKVKADYDAFGRITAIYRPDPVTGVEAGSPSLTMAYTSTYPFTTTITQANPSYSIVKKYDGMGRVIQVNAGGIITDTLYDNATTTRQSIPYASGETVYYTTTTANTSTRTTTTTAPDGTSTSNTANGLNSTTTDARGNSTMSINDIWGRATNVIPPTGPSLAYSYDPLGNLLQVTHGVSSSTSLTSPNNPGTTGLSAWWSMNEASGTRNDSSANTLHLTDVNTVASQAGLQGSAADFEKNNLEYFSRASSSTLQMGTSDIYLGMWIKAEDTMVSYPVLAAKRDVSSTNSEYQLRINASNKTVDFIVWGTTGGYTIATSTGAITEGQWYYVEGWTDKTNRTVYVNINNGTPNSATWLSNENRNGSGTASLMIGARDNNGVGEYWDGLIDEVSLYKRKLAAAERAWLYNNGASRIYTDVAPINPSTSGLAAWWTMNEASGTRNDSYTNAQHLTDVNTVASLTGKVSTAADFEKNNSEYLSRTSSSQLQMSASDIYVSAWIKAEDTMVGYPNLISKLGVDGGREFNLRVLPSGVVEFVIYDGSNTLYTIASTTAVITYGQWYFVEGWTDKANRTAYVNINNGMPVSATWPANENRNGAGTSALIVGARTDTVGGVAEYWDGLIDEVVYYKRTLSGAERSWLYNTGSGHTYSELTTVTPPTPNITTLTYNKAGQKLTMSDPDMGNWAYTYDGLGNLKTQTDALQCVLTMSYDSLNRLTNKYSSEFNCGASVNVTYNYDAGTNGKGHRTSMTTSGGISDSWTYDKRGRMLSAINQGYTTNFTYNNADMPLTMQYPDGETVTYGYNARLLLNSVAGTNTYVSSTTYDSAGRIDQRALGNSLTQNFDYYAWNAQVSSVGQGGRLQSLLTGSLQDINYQYDAVGNIKNFTDDIASETSTYNYDALDRLTSWTLGSTTENYTYDSASGNLATKAGTAINYTDTTHKHAATSAGSNTYTYDANGNQITRVIGSDTFNLSYDAENRLVQVRKNSVIVATFVYDGDGNRVRATENGVLTKFIGGHYQVTGSEVTKYYFAGTSRIAMRKYTVPSSMSVEYLLGDHLGSTSITTDTTGAKVSEMRYKPWGEVRYSWTAAAVTTPNYSLADYTFTGQYSYMDDPSTSGVTEGFGLMFYNARMYDPVLGRFTSADSIIPPGVQGYDRYAYVSNNPIKYTDPTGHQQACEDLDYCNGGGGDNNGNGGEPEDDPNDPIDDPDTGPMPKPYYLSAASSYVCPFASTIKNCTVYRLSREEMADILAQLYVLQKAAEGNATYWGNVGVGAAVIPSGVIASLGCATVVMCVGAVALDAEIIIGAQSVGEAFGGGYEASEYEDMQNYINNALLSNSTKQEFTMSVTEIDNYPTYLNIAGEDDGPIPLGITPTELDTLFGGTQP